MVIQHYITDGNVHGHCDLCGLDGSVNKVVGGHHLCSGCIDNLDARADTLVADPDTNFDDLEAAFKHTLRDNLGKTLILHYRDGDSPENTHTYTVEHAEHFELRFDITGTSEEINEVYVEFVGGDNESYRGRGLTVVGMS